MERNKGDRCRVPLATPGLFCPDLAARNLLEMSPRDSSSRWSSPTRSEQLRRRTVDHDATSKLSSMLGIKKKGRSVGRPLSDCGISRSVARTGRLSGAGRTMRCPATPRPASPRPASQTRRLGNANGVDHQFVHHDAAIDSDRFVRRVQKGRMIE